MRTRWLRPTPTLVDDQPVDHASTLADALPADATIEVDEQAEEHADDTADPGVPVSVPPQLPIG